LCAEASAKADAPLLQLLATMIRGDEPDPPPATDRERLLQLAREHRIEQLVVWRVSTRGGDLRAWFGDAAEHVRDRARESSIVDAVRNTEIAAVAAALAQVEGAEPLLFKGAALAQSHYPHSWLRPRLDTDILVARSSVPAVFDALAAMGYDRATATSGALVISQASWSRTDTFGITHALDVHWEIANWQVIARARSHRDLADRSVAMPSLGPAARALAAPDALLIACLHRAAHHRDSEELLWLYDIHLLAAGLTEAEWQVFADAADRGEVKAVCARGLALAREYFHSPVPPHMTDHLASPGDEASSIYLSKDLRLVDGLVADLRALPFRDRIRLIAEHVCPPADYMREKYGVTSRRALLFLYARRIATGLPRWFIPGVWS
jgi:hypothetical protein